MPRAKKKSACAVMPVEKASNAPLSYISDIICPLRHITPTVIGIIIKDKTLVVIITVLKKAFFSLLAVIRESLGKITFATDRTKTPTIIV